MKFKLRVDAIENYSNSEVKMLESFGFKFEKVFEKDFKGENRFFSYTIDKQLSEIELDRLEDLFQIVEKFDCDVLLSKGWKNSPEIPVIQILNHCGC